MTHPYQAPRYPYVADVNEFPRMNPFYKKKWIEALRSGNYKQAEGQLRDNDGFCCIGVACDLLKNVPIPYPGHVDEDGNRNATEVYVMGWLENEVFAPANGKYRDNLLSSRLAFPTIVKRHLNLQEVDPKLPFFDRNGETFQLSALNDIAHLNFNQIADVIEYFF